MKMSRVPVERVYMGRMPFNGNNYEFTIDCGAVYFDAVYNDEGSLLQINQYFYSEADADEELEAAGEEEELLSIDCRDFPAKAYLLTKEEKGNEWLRFHAIVPEEIDPEYFYQKYLGV
ncbi:hypothetical protein [Anaerospora hongkongensis]|uniref:hypothetical protein n=1 Tax=Anaerospora hongkongensis TaxID=244830 RepID=UPI002898A385|nr:hypothetical protein [Anaerospora hongkongensis]